MGMIYKRGEVFWIKYYSAGKPIRESTGTDKRKEAERLLKDREGRATMGAPLLPGVSKTTVDELLKDLRAHYETSGTRGLKEADTRLKPLMRFVTGRRANAISGDVLTQYIQHRQAKGLSNGTVNRELAVLGTAFKLGLENRKVIRRPVIHLLKESDPRSGFFERADFERVRRHLAKRPDLQLAISLANTFGWRMQSEVLRMELSQVDLAAGTLRLAPGTTKNREARTVYILPELIPLLEDQIQRVKMLSRKLGRVITVLFPNPRKGPFHGQRLRDFRKAWITACRNAGLAGTIRHDLRRTAVRNLVRSGVSETVAMKVSGHKTRSVFDRYNITSDADLQEASRKLHGHNLGTMPALSPSNPSVSALNSSHAPVAQLDRAAVS
jgi:integrase